MKRLRDCETVAVSNSFPSCGLLFENGSVAGLLNPQGSINYWGSKGIDFPHRSHLYPTPPLWTVPPAQAGVAIPTIALAIVKTFARSSLTAQKMSLRSRGFSMKRRQFCPAPRMDDDLQEPVLRVEPWYTKFHVPLESPTRFSYKFSFSRGSLRVVC